jgi:hypothetical protein
MMIKKVDVRVAGLLDFPCCLLPRTKLRHADEHVHALSAALVRGFGKCGLPVVPCTTISRHADKHVHALRRGGGV